MSASPYSPLRRGNAVVMSLVILALAAALIAASATSSVSGLTQTSKHGRDLQAMAAVEAVLNHRETVVAQMASSAQLLTWLDGTGAMPNFGVEYFGGCEVRWKIEPTRTITQSDLGAGPLLKFITNPSPDTYFTPDNTTGEQINEHVYLYQVAAEARLPGAAGGAGGAGDTRVQGIRYVAVNEEPLFRYVIFYAKNGAKGDLELSHGPGITIAGGVYSNGAIYLGSGTTASDWGSLNPSLGGPTTIGPDALGRSVPVVGVDGIFRMSKPLMYSAFNGYTLTGTDPGFAPGAAYSLAAGPFPNDIAGLPLGSVAAATDSGRAINPYRVLGTTLNTIGPARTINTVAVTGTSGPAAGTDSRDNERGAAYKWNPSSLGAGPQGYTGFARTRVTNARIRALKDRMRNRPFEVQRLRYFEGSASDDPDSDSDEHLEALPVFIKSDGSETTVPADAATPPGEGPTEFPGQYLQYAFVRSGTYFVRKAPFTGWTVRDLAGNVVTTNPKKVGLIIRERPYPEFDYSAALDTQPANISNRNYLPYAYGKQRQPSVWPFTEMYVSDGGYSFTGGSTWWKNGMVAVTGSHNTSGALQWYDFGGSVTVRDGTAATPVNAAESNNNDPGFYRDNWRLMHLANTQTTRTSSTLTGDTNNSGMYIPKNDFQSFQARISRVNGGNQTTNIDGRKVGLMVRPVDTSDAGCGVGTNLLTTGVNSRKPFAAMLFSPERGFFAERRREPSNLLSVPGYFTGVVSDVDGISTVVSAGDIPIAADGFGDWTWGPFAAGPYFASQSGGASASIHTGESTYNFFVGPYTRNLARYDYAGRGAWFQAEVTAAHNGSFLFPLDNGTVFHLYDNLATTFPTPATWTSGTGGWSNTNYISPTEVRFYWQSTNYSWGTQVPFNQGKRVSDGVLVTMAANTIIRYINGASPGWDYPTARNNWITSFLPVVKTEADFIAQLAGAGWEVVDIVDSDNFAAVPAATPAAFPGIPANPMTSDPMLKFALARSAYIETLPWISMRGTWYPAASTMYLPPSGVGSLTPTTNAFEPRYWTGMNPPGATSLATDADGGIVPNYAGGPAAGAAWEDGQPVGWGFTSPGPVNYPWVRIERITATNTLRFKYYYGPLVPPSDDALSRLWPNWIDLVDPATGGDINLVDTGDVAITENISTWPANLLIGLATQSGLTASLMTTTFDNVTMYTNPAGTPTYTGKKDDGTISWETVGSPNEMTKYLCSQYQVFWGTQEITEDFFRFGEGAPGTRLASENWFYNTREFWSQSRWWNEGDVPRASGWIEKETGSTTVNGGNLNSYWRQLFSRCVVLDINFANLQNYIKTRSLAEAVTDRIGLPTPAMPGGGDANMLATSFSGLVYAVRTNRYPWNPALGTVNPFNDVSGLNTADNYATLTDTELTFVNVADRPFRAPPIKSVDFHHGVMISNAANVNWGLSGAGTEQFGTSKTSIVTPGQLYVRGSLNSVDQPVDFKGTANTNKIVPFSIMADTITLLSNSWNFLDHQVDGLVVSPTGTVSGGTLFNPLGTPATSSTYRAAIVTNNQPTTKSRTFEGEGAAFVNTMMFQENWSGNTMNYTGSLVVMDTARYARSFLLEQTKIGGRTPFGIIGWQSGASWGTGTPDWCTAGGSANGCPPVYFPPNRSMSFNEDLLTEAGTPPNAPFGLTTSGVGGWIRPVQ